MWIHNRMIKVKQNDLGEVLINDVVSYTPPLNCSLNLDLSTIKIDGHDYSHKQTTDSGDVFIYKPKSDLTPSPGHVSPNKAF